MKKIALLIAAVVTVALVAGHPAQAVDVFPTCTSGDPGSTICSASTDKLFGVGGIWNRILETFTYIIGAISVLMIIIGGIRYVTSNGDQNQITGAKNTILYAVVGLVVAILAYGIVHFVISNL